MNVGVIGGGVFGLSTALALRGRGHAVTVYDPGPLPHPNQASCDISKAVRLDYGADAAYTALMERALPRWRAWNRRYGPVFVETGVLVLAGETWGAFEADSLRTLQARGHAVEVLDRAAIAQRFPLWSPRHAHGYFNPVGGFARAGATVAALAKDARDQGVTLNLGEAVTVDAVARKHTATVVAAGAWTPTLLPELARVFTPTAQTLLYFWPADLGPLTRHPTFTADVGRTGWYGFQVNAGGVFKLGHHGAGRRMDPAGPRPPAPDMIERGRAFLKASMPSLADTPVAEQRTCIYCDSFDGHFWIDAVDGRPGVFVAAGGSGHGFKFAPVLGDLVADRVEERESPDLKRFLARQLGQPSKEQARATD